MDGLVDFMNSNPHGGHALNEFWLVALVSAHTPNVKLATMKYRVWFVSGTTIACNLLINHDKSCNNPCRWRSNSFLQSVHVMWYSLQDLQCVCMRCYMLCKIYSRPACRGRHDDWSHMIVT